MKIKFLLLVIAVIFLTACAYSESPVGEYTPVPLEQMHPTDTPITETDLPVEELPSCAANFTKATVTKTVDGDTIHVEIEGKSYKVRMTGINCPEYTKEIEPFGKESSEFTETQLLGKTVYLEVDVSNTDKYGRLLRYIWLQVPTEITEQEISTKMFNAKLILNGYARTGYYPPDIKYNDYFKSLQKKAKNNKKGMWSLDKEVYKIIYS